MTTSVEIRRIIERELRIIWPGINLPTIYSDKREGAVRRYKPFMRMTRDRALTFNQRLVDVLSKEGYEVTKTDIVSCYRFPSYWYPVVVVRDRIDD